MRYFLPFLFLLFCAESPAQAPGQPLADAIAYAHKDCLSLPPQVRVRTRYLSAASIPIDSRAAFWRVLSGHVNGLSRRAEIIRPRIVDGTTGSLFAVILDDYGWPPDVFDQLADADPYFYADYETPEIWTRTHPDGRKEKFTKRVRVRALADWLSISPAHAVATQQLPTLLQARAPIVHAPKFLSQTAIQADRKPGYYDFLGIRAEADLHRLIGFDTKLAAGRDYREAVAMSGVTQQPRRISADKTIEGIFWRTFDNFLAINERNPLRVLDDKNFKFDASEQFAPGPNGMMVWALFAANGTRQDSVPDKIAKDGFSTSNDGRIHVGLSCVRCHLAGLSSGINDIDPWARTLYVPPVRLKALLLTDYVELRRQYLRSLAAPIEDSRRIYARAIDQATGLKPAEYAAAYALAWHEYEDLPVPLQRIEREIGLPADQIKARLLLDLKSQDRTLGGQDSVLAMYNHPNFRGIGIRQFEELLPLLMNAMRGVTVPP